MLLTCLLWAKDLIAVAQKYNDAHVLPPIDAERVSVQLPPDKFCVTSANYQVWLTDHLVV